jgi:hypothetical protein
VKNINPPGRRAHHDGEADDGERNRRALVLQAEGDRQAAITRAEGEKQAAVTRAEGEKQSAILAAEGAAQARLRSAKRSRKRSVAWPRDSRRRPGAVHDRDALHRQLREMTRTNNSKVIFMPMENVGDVGERWARSRKCSTNGSVEWRERQPVTTAAACARERAGPMANWRLFLRA